MLYYYCQHFLRQQIFAIVIWLLFFILDFWRFASGSYQLGSPGFAHHRLLHTTPGRTSTGHLFWMWHIIYYKGEKTWEINLTHNIVLKAIRGHCCNKKEITLRKDEFLRWKGHKDIKNSTSYNVKPEEILAII